MSCMHVASTCLVETRQKKHDNVKTSKNKNSLGTDTMKFTTAKGKLLPPHVPPCGCCGKAGEATKFQKTTGCMGEKKDCIFANPTAFGFLVKKEIAKNGQGIKYRTPKKNNTLYDIYKIFHIYIPYYMVPSQE